MGSKVVEKMNIASGLARVLLAVPESDCHVVACKLLQLYLEHLGYEVRNLGVTTPSAEIAAEAEKCQPIAILLSSQNGHALMDLQTLREELKQRGIDVPVYLGGNLTVGCHDSPEIVRRKFTDIGIEVLGSFEDAALNLLALPGVRTTRYLSSSATPSERRTLSNGGSL